MEKIWVAELADSDDFEVLVGATNEEEAEHEAYEMLGDILSVFLFVIYSWNVGNGEPSPTQEWQYACQYENRRNGTVAFRDVLGRTQAVSSGSPDSISAVVVKGVSIEHRKMKEKRTSGNGTA